MKLSLAWLSDFVDLQGVDPVKLAAELTEKVAEVEHVVSAPANQAAIVVGEIEKVEPHPDADKLQVCQVRIDKETVQIVCGGKNVRAGLKVAVALPGANVRWHGEGEPVTLAKAKLRGVESYGMICSAAELEVAPELLGSEPADHGIVELQTAAPAGTKLAEAYPALADTIFEIDNHAITHRPDLFSQFGLAREVATLLRKELKIKNLKLPEFNGQLQVKVTEPELCARYSGLTVSGIEIKPSPAQIQERLAACGIRAINNVVDATNYVLLELGQPMHAFDAAKLQGELTVRKAKQGEKLATLDGETRELTTEMLVIADAAQPVALAGVMGGANSEVDEKTTELILEAANFDAVTVRRTSIVFGLRSESSLRFEKRLDPELPPLALARCLEILRETCPDLQIGSGTDIVNFKSEKRVLILPLARVAQRLGTEIDSKEIEQILKSLEFEVVSQQSNFEVTVPSFRAGRDIAVADDLIEEIARHHGYNRIASEFPALRMVSPLRDPARELKNRLEDAMVGYGFHETCTLALTDARTLENAGQDIEKAASLVNPPSEDHKYLRTSLVATLLVAAARNLREQESVRLFEISKVFQKVDADVVEPRFFSAVLAGEPEPFAVLRGVLSSLFQDLKLAVEFKPIEARNPPINIHPGRAAQLWVGPNLIGLVAELHPLVAENFELPQSAYFCLHFDNLVALPREVVKAESLSRFPGVPRDIAVVVPERMLAIEVQTAIQAVDPRIVDLRLFDTYTGKGIESGDKSLAFSFQIVDPEKTLEDKESEAVLQKIMQNLEKLGGKIRA
jgi:phenylalanyl-tRNA synthetase beta chain